MAHLYAVVDARQFYDTTAEFTDVSLSQNMALTKLPVRSVPAFLGNLATSWVNGTTLFLDYAFPTHPDNLGHWMELLLPVYCALSAGEWRAHVPPGDDAYITYAIFPNMRRGQLAVRQGAWPMAAGLSSHAGWAPGCCCCAGRASLLRRQGAARRGM